MPEFTAADWDRARRVVGIDPDNRVQGLPDKVLDADVDGPSDEETAPTYRRSSRGHRQSQYLSEKW